MQNDTVNLKGILAFLGLLAVTLVIVFAAMRLMSRHLEKKAQRTDASSPSSKSVQPYFPAPREQPSPIDDLKTLRAQEEAELTTYAWINKTAGIVRIPIDRAMDVITQREEAKP